MLDTLFWIAVFVSIVCGILIMGIELYDEWAETASCYNIVAEDLKNSGYLSASFRAPAISPEIKSSSESRLSKLTLDNFVIYVKGKYLTASGILGIIGLVICISLAVGYAFSSPADAVAQMLPINSLSDDIMVQPINVDLRLVKFSE